YMLVRVACGLATPEELRSLTDLPFTPLCCYNLNSVRTADSPNENGEHPLMSAENPAAAQKSEPQTPAEKTDAPHRARNMSVTLMETDDFVCIKPDTPLSEAIGQMKKDEGGCAIVCDAGGKVVGIFTERDLLNKI